MLVHKIINTRKENYTNLLKHCQLERNKYNCSAEKINSQTTSIIYNRIDIN